MKGKRILYALEHVDEKYIEEAMPGKRKAGKPGLVRWVAVAACFCVAVGGVVALVRPGKPLPQITIPRYGDDGTGFEGLMYYSAEELENGNPWREDMALDTLPVYRNGCFDPSGYGAPFGLSEAEMTEKLENAARALRLTIVSTKADKSDGTMHPADTVYSIRAVTGDGNLTAYADGTLVYDLPEGYSPPEGFRFTYGDTSDAQAKTVIENLMHEYAALLNFGRPEIVLQGDYTYDGDYLRRYFVYDAVPDATERILNYHFRAAQFVPDENGNLMSVCLYDRLCKAEKLGEYPLISVAEAKEKLLSGQYRTTAPEAMPGEEFIAKTELVYRVGWSEEILLPYYRFYVELQDCDGWQMTWENGLKTYGTYYVPAIPEKYISGFFD